MVVDAVALLLVQLNQYIHQADGNPLGTADPAIWGNIAQLDNPDVSTNLENQIVLSLVNLEEEKTLKNGKTFISESNGVVNYFNPPLHLNLFLLFTANYRNYETALKRLTQVMLFFQGKKKFTLSNSPVSNLNTASINELSLTMDFLSLSFEEVNHLWGSLGGKQLPFAAYQGRLVTIQDRRVLEGGGYIQEIEVTGKDTR